jgi:hypothetical protein
MADMVEPSKEENTVEFTFSEDTLMVDAVILDPSNVENTSEFT